MNRGDWREDIFRGGKDREGFLTTLAEKGSMVMTYSFPDK
jgi:hypothetical protein